MSKKAITLSIRSDNGPSVSRERKDEGTAIILAELVTENRQGVKLGESGQIFVRCTVNDHGLIAVCAQEASGASRERELFYAQVAIDSSEPSGVKVRQETYPPARPAGALNLTAAQVETLRHELAVMNDRAGLGSRRSDRDGGRIAEHREAYDRVRAILFPDKAAE